MTGRSNSATVRAPRRSVRTLFVFVYLALVSKDEFVALWVATLELAELALDIGMVVELRGSDIEIAILVRTINPAFGTDLFVVISVPVPLITIVTQGARSSFASVLVSQQISAVTHAIAVFAGYACFGAVIDGIFHFLGDG